MAVRFTLDAVASARRFALCAAKTYPYLVDLCHFWQYPMSPVAVNPVAAFPE
jgi:hypothetical protein